MSATPSPALPGLPVVLPAGMTLNLSVGAVTISTWLSMFALGIVLSSSYLYFLRFPSDRTWLKVLVGVVTAVCVADTVANLVWAYEWIVKLWGSIPGAGAIPRGLFVNVLCCATACALTQSFYAWRLLGLGRQNIAIVAIILLSALVQQGFVVWVVVYWAKHSAFEHVREIFPTAYGWLITGLVGDVMVSAGLLYYQVVKSRASNKKQNLAFQVIVSKGIQANMLALIFQTITLVLFRIEVGMFHLLNDVVISKIYAFSLLTTLNVRSTSWAIFSMSTTSRSKSEHISLASMPPRTTAHVRITQTITVTREQELEQDDFKPTDSLPNAR